MGTVQYQPIIVRVAYNEKQTKRVHKKCIKLFGKEMVTSMIFGYNSNIFFMIGPTGSKLGWDPHIEFYAAKDLFLDWLHEEYVDDDLMIELTYPSWGDLETSIEIDGSL